MAAEEIKLAYEQLKSNNQERFQLLGVLPVEAPFDPDLLVALWEISLPEITTTIELLNKAGLLQPDAKASKKYKATLYKLEPTAYTYARELLETSLFQEMADERYKRFMFALLERYDQAGLDELMQFSQYQPQLLALGERLLKQLNSPSVTDKLMGNTARYVVFVNDIALGLYRLSNRTKNRDFDWDMAQEQCEIALSYYLQTLPLCRLVGDKKNEAEACLGVGRTSEEGIEEEQAVEHLERAIVLYQELGNKEEEARATRQLGNIYMTSRTHSPFTYYKKALELFQAAGVNNREVEELASLIETLQFSARTMNMLKGMQSGETTPEDFSNLQAAIPSVPEAFADQPVANAFGQLGEMMQKMMQMTATTQEIKAASKQGASGIKALLERYDREDSVAKSKIIQELATSEDKEVIELIYNAVSDFDRLVSNAAINALSHRKEERAFQLLLDLLTQEDEKSMSAASALGKRGDQRAVEPLLKFFTVNKDTAELAVLGAVARALGKLGDSRAVEPLLTLLPHKDASLQLDIIQALGKLRDERAVIAINSFLKHENVDLREAAANALDQIYGTALTEDELDELLEAVEEAEPSEALRLVREFAGDDEANAITRLFSFLVLTSDFQEKIKTEDYVWEVLKGYGEKVIEFAKQELSSFKSDKSVMAAVVLKEVGQAKAADYLLPILSDENHPAYFIASQTLSNLGDKRAIEPLAKVLLAEGKSNAEIGEYLHSSPMSFAAKALYQLGAHDYILQALEDERVLVRYNALFAFQEVNSQDARYLPALEKIAEDHESTGPSNANMSNVARITIKQIKKAINKKS